MLRRFLERQKSYPGLLSADEFHRPINAFLDSHLAKYGFVRPKRGVWVRKDCSSARPMIEIWHYKGKISAPVWGFALTYVPHFNNSFTKLYWHRTAKSARLDVFPFDEFDRTQELNRISTIADHEAAAERVLGAAVAQATDFFESFRSTEDLLPLFERLRRDKSDGLGYWNFTNMPVAHAFTLRVNGDHAGGKSILDKFVQRMDVSRKALDDLMDRYDKATASWSLL